ncbi:MAG: 2-C-methyl-D-erythritol 4-phosphate cytidylyltransferase [Bacteroidia bacterium]
MKHAAILVAGGTGTRMGTKIPKQFLTLQGVPVLVHTLKRFLGYDSSMPIVLVMHTGSQSQWADLAQQHLSETERQRIILCDGGAERSDSVHNGMEALANHIEAHDEYLVAIHDAVRPFIHTRLLDEAFATAAAQGASVCCVAVKSSIREVTNGGSQAVDRSRFFHVQTPQTFAFSPLLQAYRNRPHNRFTDDASLYEATGKPVTICAGSYDNIKLTTPEDLFVAEKILKGF